MAEKIFFVLEEKQIVVWYDGTQALL